MSFHLGLYLVLPDSSVLSSELAATDNMETCQLVSHHCGHSLLLASPLYRKWKQESMREEQNTFSYKRGLFSDRIGVPILLKLEYTHGC